MASSGDGQQQQQHSLFSQAIHNDLDAYGTAVDNGGQRVSRRQQAVKRLVEFVLFFVKLHDENCFSLQDDVASCRADQATAANQQTNDGNKKNQQANGNKNSTRGPRRVTICSTAPGFNLPGFILPLADKENQSPATSNKKTAVINNPYNKKKAPPCAPAIPTRRQVFAPALPTRRNCQPNVVDEATTAYFETFSQYDLGPTEVPPTAALKKAPPPPPPPPAVVPATLKKAPPPPPPKATAPTAPLTTTNPVPTAPAAAAAPAALKKVPPPPPRPALVEHVLAAITTKVLDGLEKKATTTATCPTNKEADELCASFLPSIDVENAEFVQWARCSPTLYNDEATTNIVRETFGNTHRYGQQQKDAVNRLVD
jgi:hypothetical protein